MSIVLSRHRTKATKGQRRLSLLFAGVGALLVLCDSGCGRCVSPVDWRAGGPKTTAVTAAAAGDRQHAGRIDDKGSRAPTTACTPPPPRRRRAVRQLALQAGRQLSGRAYMAVQWLACLLLYLLPACHRQPAYQLPACLTALPPSWTRGSTPLSVGACGPDS